MLQTTASSNYQVADNTAVNLSFGVTGLICFTFNLIMLVLYVRDKRLRKHISFMLLQMFIFCMLQGIVTGLVFPLYRYLRMTQAHWWCVTGRLVVAFFDSYLLILVPLLVIERYISIKSPYLSRTASLKWSIIATVVGIAFILLAVVMPFAPLQENLRSGGFSDSNHSAQQQKILNKLTCNGDIDRFNAVSPTVMLILDIICVIVVITAYARMYCIAKNGTYEYNSVHSKKKDKLRKSAIIVLLVSVIFIITTIPYGIILSLWTLCDSGISLFDHMETCFHTNLKIKFAFGVLAAMGGFFAPLVFTMINTRVRQAVRRAICCDDSNNKVGPDSTSDIIGETYVMSCKEEGKSPTSPRKA